ncbi:MAG: serine/threonine-protein kinase, partial [Polyangiales bacterium]
MSDPIGPGAMIGAYRIERELGGGGMGTVYEALEPTIGKRVAIKVMRASVSGDGSDGAQQASRFEREARAANEVRHPAIVDVFAFGKLGDGRPYLVMSLLEGHSLRDEIARRGKLPPQEAWAIAREAADAISSAHAVSVIHRDLKPDNVFLERSGDRPMRVRLLDFGIAKVQSREDLERLTNTGVPLGTPSYMAPELWWGSDIDARVDQYALGITLFEAITGRLPFSADGFMQLVQKHLHEEPPPLGCSKEIDAFVARLLAKKPEDRFESMSAAIVAGDRAFDVAAFAPTMPAMGTPFDPTVPALAPIAGETRANVSVGRVLLVHALTIACALGIACAVGYAGVERWHPVEWYKCAGYPAHFAFGAFLVALVFLPILAVRRTRTGPSTAMGWFALVPALFGIAGTWLDWAKVTETLPRLPLPERFAVMNDGFFEVGTLRFIGFILSLALLLSASTIPALSGDGKAAPRLQRRESIGALIGA